MARKRNKKQEELKAPEQTEISAFVPLGTPIYAGSLRELIENVPDNGTITFNQQPQEEFPDFKYDEPESGKYGFNNYVTSEREDKIPNAALDSVDRVSVARGKLQDSGYYTGDHFTDMVKMDNDFEDFLTDTLGLAAEAIVNNFKDYAATKNIRSTVEMCDVIENYVPGFKKDK